MIDGFRQLCRFLDDTDPAMLFFVVPAGIAFLALYLFPPSD